MSHWATVPAPGGFGMAVPFLTKATTTSWPFRKRSVCAAYGETRRPSVLEGERQTMTSTRPVLAPQRLFPVV